MKEKEEASKRRAEMLEKAEAKKVGEKGRISSY